MEKIRNINLSNILVDETYKCDFIKNGAYGSVQRVIFNCKECAVKNFHKRDQFTKNLNEVVHLNACSHKNIVKLFGAGPDLEKKELFYFIMEFAPNGSLDDILHEQKHVDYSLEQGLSWIRQCCEAVNYMHSRFDPPFLHRDIKPSNLLIFDWGRFVKLCDFGTVKKVQNNENTVESGTFLYMAPEVMISVKERNAHYNEKCDVYSIGVVLWEILTRSRPFSDLNTSFGILLHVAIKKERLPDIPNCPEILQKLLKICWEHNFKDRPDVGSVIKILNIFLEKMNIDELPKLNLRNYSMLDKVLDKRKSNCSLDGGLDHDISIAAGNYPASDSDCYKRSSLDENDLSTMPNINDTNNVDQTNDQATHNDENYQLQLDLIDETLKPKDPLQDNRESKMIFDQHTVLLKRYVHLNLDCQQLEMENNELLNKLSSDDIQKERIKRYCALKIREQRDQQGV